MSSDKDMRELLLGLSEYIEYIEVTRTLTLGRPRDGYCYVHQKGSICIYLRGNRVVKGGAAVMSWLKERGKSWREEWGGKIHKPSLVIIVDGLDEEFFGGE